MASCGGRSQKLEGCPPQPPSFSLPRGVRRSRLVGPGDAVFRSMVTSPSPPPILTPLTEIPDISSYDIPSPPRGIVPAVGGYHGRSPPSTRIPAPSPPTSPRQHTPRRESVSTPTRPTTIRSAPTGSSCSRPFASSPLARRIILPDTIPSLLNLVPRPPRITISDADASTLIAASSIRDSSNTAPTPAPSQLDRPPRITITTADARTLVAASSIGDSYPIGSPPTDPLPHLPTIPTIIYPPRTSSLPNLPVARTTPRPAFAIRSKDDVDMLLHRAKIVSDRVKMRIATDRMQARTARVKAGEVAEQEWLAGLHARTEAERERAQWLEEKRKAERVPGRLIGVGFPGLFQEFRWLKTRVGKVGWEVERIQGESERLRGVREKREAWERRWFVGGKLQRVPVEDGADEEVEDGAEVAGWMTEGEDAMTEAEEEDGHEEDAEHNFAAETGTTATNGLVGVAGPTTEDDKEAKAEDTEICVRPVPNFSLENFEQGGHEELESSEDCSSCAEEAESEDEHTYMRPKTARELIDESGGWI